MSDSLLLALCLLASVFVGVSCSLGESTCFGFLKTFPGEAVGYYSSGTGFAGVFGATTFLLLQAFGISNGIKYSVLSLFMIVYLLNFLWLNKQKRLYRYVQVEKEFADT